MKREERYPDTKTFHYYNANPRNKVTDDCVIRAICTAMDVPYETVYKELFEMSIKTGYMVNDKKCYQKYIESKGWKKYKQPRKFDNTKYTGKEFCERSIGPGRHIIAHLGGHHIVAIVDNKVYDIWNSTDGCIGNYWVKE